MFLSRFMHAHATLVNEHHDFFVSRLVVNLLRVKFFHVAAENVSWLDPLSAEQIEYGDGARAGFCGYQSGAVASEKDSGFGFHHRKFSSHAQQPFDGS
jgi:hypothetical protein